MNLYPEQKRRRAIAAFLLAAATATALGCTAEQGRTEPAVSSPVAEKLESGDRSLPASVLDRLRSTLDIYEECRASLAHDRLETLNDPAFRLAEALAQAAADVPTIRPGVKDRIEQAAGASEALASAGDLEAARAAFAEVSLKLMALAQMDPALVEGWHAFSCPMVEGFNRWMQPSPELENPFMGRAMPSCGTGSDWQVEEKTGGAGVDSSQSHLHGGDEIAFYTCSMHPSVKRQEPGTCPICSMDLTPVTRQEVETGVILVDAQRRQLIGVRTALVQTRSVNVEVRAVGRVAYDEKRLADVTLKNRGWIGTLHVNEPGQRVEKGQTLFTLYSPELYAAQEELLAAVSSQAAARASSAPDRADYLVQAARKRLRLWDLQEWQIDRLAKVGEPSEQLPVVSPVTGYVVEKNVVEGAAVAPGSRIYRIAGLERVWIEAEVYESDLPLIELGQQATIDLSYLPGRSFEGQVSFVYPYLDAASRTGRVRVELENPALEFKPDMYANVQFAIDRGERVVVPIEAVLYAGPRRLVFVDLGEGRLKPKEIQIGVRSGDWYEVIAGLVVGDTVVTSSNFLIAAESRLKSATEMW